MKSLIKFFILIFIIFLMVFGIFVLLDKQKNISYSPQQINFENMYLKPDFSLLKLDSPDGCENSIYYGEGFVQNCVGTIFSQQDQNNNEIGENIFVNIPGSNLGFNYQLTELSLPKIGQTFGGRDHTTVMHADRKIRQLMAERRSIYNQVNELTTRIKQQAR